MAFETDIDLFLMLQHSNINKFLILRKCAWVFINNCKNHKKKTKNVSSKDDIEEKRHTDTDAYSCHLFFLYYI